MKLITDEIPICVALPESVIARARRHINLKVAGKEQINKLHNGRIVSDIDPATEAILAKAQANLRSTKTLIVAVDIQDDGDFIVRLR